MKPDTFTLGAASRATSTVLSEVGLLLTTVGSAMGIPLLVSVLYAEWYTALAFLISGLATTGFGAFLHFPRRTSPAPDRANGMLVAAVGWFAAALFGALPFVLTAWLTPADVAHSFVPPGEDYVSSLQYFRNPLHALFESMSAYTTTGLTMSVHEPSIGYGLLFYRSFAQWIGGAGVIALTLAILRTPRGVGDLSLFASETHESKLRPTIRSTSRAIWRVYCGLTLMTAVYLTLATLIILPDYGLAATIFDAVNHAMTAHSTGGFSTLDDSIAGYGSYAMEIIHIPPMLLGAVSIPLYYRILDKRRFGLLWEDVQVRSLVVLSAAGSAVLTLLLVVSPAVGDVLREGVFQFISALTTTGWQTSAIGEWSPAAVIFITATAMIVGGSAGATVGGIKIIRAWLIMRGVGWQVSRILLPRKTVVSLKFGSRNLDHDGMTEELADAALFSLLYLMLLAVGVLVTDFFMGTGFGLEDAFFESASAQGTVGLSSGITDPSMPTPVEVLFIIQMWAGRLEIIPVMILVRAVFFGLKPKAYH